MQHYDIAHIGQQASLLLQADVGYMGINMVHLCGRQRWERVALACVKDVQGECNEARFNC